ncbi:anti-sigma regulatory factor [Mangrovicoccus sp. HB161399]|uniref:anti-sigma regulatory factor n=1 Tax=Mangrovicoccus sp. HB161399 TaxID=2720392 RepID=UPI0020A68323|nr:anti-sigma regulatory factor [Mangrovicoccus sp. HB161399]
MMAGLGLAPEQTQRIERDGDVVAARQIGRHLAAEIGFSRPEQALIATAISELARNIVSYAERGTIAFATVERDLRQGIRIVAEDRGPGIPDLHAAMTDGFSTGNSLGLGLPGTQRIMDEFDIRSIPGEGVTVTVVKWKSR